MRIRRKLSKEDKEMRRYHFFEDAVQITEKFKRFADTTFTQNYVPTFGSYQELETSRLTYVAKEEEDTRIITTAVNQIQDILKGRLPKKELNRLLHHLRDLGSLCRSIYAHQSKQNYPEFQPRYFHPEYDPRRFSLLVEFMQFLIEGCTRLLLGFSLGLSSKLLELKLFLFITKPSKTDESPPVPPPIVVRPQIQPNSPNIAA